MRTISGTQMEACMGVQEKATRPVVILDEVVTTFPTIRLTDHLATVLLDAQQRGDVTPIIDCLRVAAFFGLEDFKFSLTLRACEMSYLTDFTGLANPAILKKLAMQAVSTRNRNQVRTLLAIAELQQAKYPGVAAGTDDSVDLFEHLLLQIPNSGSDRAVVEESCHKSQPKTLEEFAAAASDASRVITILKMAHEACVDVADLTRHMLRNIDSFEMLKLVVREGEAVVSDSEQENSALIGALDRVSEKVAVEGEPARLQQLLAMIRSIDRGARLSAQSGFITAELLRLIAETGNTELIKVLRERGVIKHGLAAVARRSMWQVMQVLLEQGAGSELAEGEEDDGSTALHHAARHGSAMATALLLRAGSSPSHANRRGATALHVAGSREVVAALVAAGADVAAKDSEGHTPWHAAENEGRGAVMEALREAGADEQQPNPSKERRRRELERAEAAREFDRAWKRDVALRNFRELHGDKYDGWLMM